MTLSESKKKGFHKYYIFTLVMAYTLDHIYINAIRLVYTWSYSNSIMKQFEMYKKDINYEKAWQIFYDYLQTWPLDVI